MLFSINVKCFRVKWYVKFTPDKAAKKRQGGMELNAAGCHSLRISAIILTNCHIGQIFK